MNKKIIFATAFLISATLMAAPGKSVEIKREKATEVMANRSSKENKEYLSGVSKSIAETAGMGGSKANVDRALSQGSADLLVSVTRLADKKDVAALALVVELSEGVKSETDANTLALIAEKGLEKITTATDFVTAIKSAIANGKSLTEALKIGAEKRKDKSMSVEDWIKELLKC